MLPTACIMTSIITINNPDGQTDIYVTLTGMMDEEHVTEDTLTIACLPYGMLRYLYNFTVIKTFTVYTFILRIIIKSSYK